MILGKTTWDRWLLVLGLSALWLVAGTVAAGAQASCATTGATGFAELTFDLGSGIFDTVLPFDVPVRLCTLAPENTRVATVEYAEQPLRSGPLRINPDTCDILGSTTASWSPEASSVPNSSGVVRWLLGRFEAERYYAFCFRFERELSEDELSQLKANATDIIGDRMAKESDATMTVAETQALCQDLKAELLEIAGADRVIEHGTLFACDDTRQEMSDLASDLNAKVLGPQVRIDRILRGVPASGPVPPSPSLDQVRRGLFQNVNGILDDPSLERLADLVEQRAASDGDVAQTIDQGFGEALTLLRPGGPTVLANQLGIAGGGTDISLDSDPQTVLGLAAGGRQVAEALEQLSALIRTMTGTNPPGGVLTGLSEDETKRLVTLADTSENTAEDAQRLAGVLESLARQLTARRLAIAAAVEKFHVAAAQVVVADASSTDNFATRQSNYVSLDAGMLFAPELDDAVPYVGTNIYFRPVNKNAPLRTLGSFGQTFSRRFSLTLGLTGSGIGDGGGDGVPTREDLFSSQSLLAGFGVRLNDSVRLGAGGLVFKEIDPNPLVDDQRLAATYYLSLSFDIDMVKLFGRLFGDQLLPANSVPSGP